MKHQVKYQLNVSFDAMDVALKAVLGDKAEPAYRTDWVDSCDPFDEDEHRFVEIIFPNPRHPELTMALFLKLMCVALPISKHPQTGFFVTATAEVDGKTAVNFSDSYQIKYGEDSFYSEFWYEGKLFSQELQKKLDDIGKIVKEGTDRDYY